jgi:hypothetical protein
MDAFIKRSLDVARIVIAVCCAATGVWLFSDWPCFARIAMAGLAAGLALKLWTR